MAENAYSSYERMGILYPNDTSQNNKRTRPTSTGMPVRSNWSHYHNIPPTHLTPISKLDQSQTPPPPTPNP